MTSSPDNRIQRMTYVLWEELTTAECRWQTRRSHLADSQQPGQMPNIAELVQALHYIYNPKCPVFPKHTPG